MRPPHDSGPAGPLRIEVTRGDLVESVHAVSVAVTDQHGALVASSGDAERPTWWRSAAKPFQALPLLADGAADAFGLGDEELALACASHSSEPAHLELTDRFLAKIGCTEADLACGPHPPLGAAVAEAVMRGNVVMTPRWSNCSGKHAGMLALAKHHGWPTAGYERASHPVQRRIVEEVARWSGVPAGSVRLAVDGCTAACFALPLRAMAAAYARFAASTEPAAARLRGAMTGHPHLVAGTGRFCTELMAAWPGRLLAKIGAEGVYSAAIVHEGGAWGIALKVEDGDMRSAPIALHAVLARLAERLPSELTGARAVATVDALARWASPAILNTRGEVTGAHRAAGALTFHDAIHGAAAASGAGANAPAGGGTMRDRPLDGVS
jgi:L-asparaginase II